MPHHLLFLTRFASCCPHPSLVSSQALNAWQPRPIVAASGNAKAPPRTGFLSFGYPLAPDTTGKKDCCCPRLSRKLTGACRIASRDPAHSSFGSFKFHASIPIWAVHTQSSIAYAPPVLLWPGLTVQRFPSALVVKPAVMLAARGRRSGQGSRSTNLVTLLVLSIPSCS